MQACKFIICKSVLHYTHKRRIFEQSSPKPASIKNVMSSYNPEKEDQLGKLESLSAPFSGSDARWQQFRQTERDVCK